MIRGDAEKNRVERFEREGHQHAACPLTSAGREFFGSRHYYRSMERQKLYSEQILDPKYLQLVGAIALESSFNENMLARTLWMLLGVDPEMGHAITGPLAISGRIALLQEVGSRKLKGDETALEELAAVIKAFTDSNAKRNTAIHGEWGPDEEDAFRSGFAPAGSLFPEPKPAKATNRSKGAGKKNKVHVLTAPELEAVAMSLEESRQRMYKFTMKYWRALLLAQSLNKTLTALRQH